MAWKMRAMSLQRGGRPKALLEALTLTLKPQGRMRTGCRLAPPGRPARRCACWPWRPSLHPRRRRRRLGHHRPGPGGALPLQGRATEEISGEDASASRVSSFGTDAWQGSRMWWWRWGRWKEVGREEGGCRGSTDRDHPKPRHRVLGGRLQYPTTPVPVRNSRTLHGDIIACYRAGWVPNDGMHCSPSVHLGGSTVAVLTLLILSPSSQIQMQVAPNSVCQAGAQQPSGATRRISCLLGTETRFISFIPWYVPGSLRDVLQHSTFVPPYRMKTYRNNRSVHRENQRCP